MKTNIAAAICFMLFVGCGAAVAVGHRFFTRVDRRRLTNTFVLVALFTSFSSGLSQHDMWPFSSWKMMTGLTAPATRELPTLSIVGVDAGGNEHAIDYRAWNPLSPEELDSWLRHDFYQLDAAARQRVASYLLGRANRAREAALTTGLAYPNRWLGPLTAPTHLLHPTLWSRSDSVPKIPFVGLRIYEESWDLEARGRGGAPITRVQVFENLPR